MGWLAVEVCWLAVEVLSLLVLNQDTLLKDRQSSLVSSQPIRILFICCVYFTLIMKLKLCAADQQSALSLVGSKVLVCSVPCQDCVQNKKGRNIKVQIESLPTYFIEAWLEELWSEITLMARDKKWKLLVTVYVNIKTKVIKS